MENQNETSPTKPTEKLPTATPTKTGAGKIIAAIEAEPAKIFSFIGKEAGVIAKLFAQEEPAVQLALKQVSQAVQVIKTNLSENPVVVSYLLRQINPAWSEDTLNGLLSTATTALNIEQSIAAPTLAETISNLQAHASQLPNAVSGNNLWTGLFNTLATLVAPATPWSKILTFGVFIYNTFVKKA